MLILLWLVRIYKWLLIAWVLMTWIPYVGGSSFHAALGVPIMPVLNLFGFLQLGPFGFQAIVPLVILHYVEGWLEQQVGPAPGEPGGPSASSPEEIVVEARSVDRDPEPPR